MIISTVVSAYAVHLVVERSQGEPRRAFFSQRRFVATKEFSGAAFYLLLIVISWAGVFCSSIWPTPGH